MSAHMSSHAHQCTECYELEPCDMDCSLADDGQGSPAVCAGCSARSSDSEPAARRLRRFMSDRAERLIGEIDDYAQALECKEPLPVSVSACVLPELAGSASSNAELALLLRRILFKLCGRRPVWPLGPENPAVEHAAQVLGGGILAGPLDIGAKTT